MGRREPAGGLRPSKTDRAGVNAKGPALWAHGPLRRPPQRLAGRGPGHGGRDRASGVGLAIRARVGCPDASVGLPGHGNGRRGWQMIAATIPAEDAHGGRFSLSAPLASAEDGAEPRQGRDGVGGPMRLARAFRPHCPCDPLAGPLARQDASQRAPQAVERPAGGETGLCRAPGPRESVGIVHAANHALHRQSNGRSSLTSSGVWIPRTK